MSTAPPPPKNGDYAFLLHVLTSLKSTGKAAIILPHGVLFRGHAEAAIRRQLLTRGFIKGIVGLPANLFYGTGIPACIVVLDKAGAASRSGVFMIDASKGFMKDGAKNRLRSQDIHKIVDIFNKQTDVERYSRMVPLSEIATEANDYSLNIPRYIDSSEPEDVQDLHAHLHGGIPDRDIDALSGFWDAFPTLRGELFDDNRPGYCDLVIQPSDVQQTILGASEFAQFNADVHARVAEWYAAHRETLAAISENTRPDNLIATLGDDLLARFRSTPLLDPYDVYEQLLSYWHETLHDDVFLIMRDGWLEAAKPRAARILGYDKNKKPKFEDCHIQFGTGVDAERYVMDLIQPELVIARYRAEQQASVNELTDTADDAARAVEAHIEEHAVEGGLLWDALDDKGKVTGKSVTAAIKQAKADDDEDAVAALNRVLDLLKREAVAKKAAKDGQQDLDRAALKEYGTFTEADVQTLVLSDKWEATVSARVGEVLTALVSHLVTRLQALGDRYDATLGDLYAQADELSDRVATHLAEMGVS